MAPDSKDNTTRASASVSDTSASGSDKPPQKRLTVTFQDLAVEVHGFGEDYWPTCASVVTDLIPFMGVNSHRRHILQNITGQVRPGEMLLVLGRPGSGCTSLLKIISNHREEFHAVTGQVQYGNVGPKQAKEFRHQIIMNTEEDIHFPTLTVGQVLEFATSTKLPGERPDHLASTDAYVSHSTNSILGDLAIHHTKQTIVGNEYIRGVSGGERKRVSLAEVMAAQAPLQCWDNSTRGLDASSAVDFARVLRKAADEQQRSIVATLYQAGNGIYNQFDKVLVLAEGREIYYGPASEARKYFEDMGFICPSGANIADFLTSVAVHTERSVAPGYEDKIPNTAAEFETRYRESTTFQRMTEDIGSKSQQALEEEISDLRLARKLEKIRNVSFLSRKTSPYLASFSKQVLACTKRQFMIIWGDRWSNCLQIGSAIIMALVTGSLFYNMPNTSQSIFTRPGALFYPILLWALNRLSETTASFMGRPILARHKRFAFNRPAAYAFACTVADIPLVAVFLSLFNIVFYFIVGFQHDAGKFFTNWFIYVIATLCFTSLYRAIGAWCKHFGLASQISGLITMAMMVYGGYLIPVPSMHPWFGWIHWINPASYALQAALASEFGGREMECVSPQYVPFGGAYDETRYRSCTVAGSVPGASSTSGEQYARTHFSTTLGQVWRNVGIIIALWIFFAAMTAIGFEINIHQGSGAKILFDRRSRQKETAAQRDEEKTQNSQAPEQGDHVSAGQTIFTFKNINYFVHHEGKEKQLLKDVSGFVKPGDLVALMGSSGAGKTTLMDVLAQRKDAGRIEGSIMVNGHPQGITFQRTTGYCEQNDVHEPTATVLEALLFSARLRQSYKIPDSEKQEYVHRIMELLELTTLQHAVIGSPGSGLSIEQRKRLTLATELVARPSLLFLDEPTSGLDGQSAFEICRFLRKLAAAGQTIICTIHQPSATLFEAFDVLLLLARGGRTTYFGPTGRHSSIVLDYFSRNGAPTAVDVNPAEHIVDVVQGRFGNDIDWPERWLESPEREQMMTELDNLNNTGVQQNEKESLAEGRESDFATPITYQIRLVTLRQCVALWRNPDYVWNKISLHVTNSLFGGFTYWMIGDSSFDLQLRLMAIFNFVFVAPGCINQMQPMFIANRDIFETREKKSKAYHWFAFISAQLFSEIPVLIICGTIYFVCWYFTAGFPVRASVSGQVYLQMLFYELLYTSIGQAIAAYSPNAYFAALANPMFIGAALINFCGVVVPYSQIQAFWRYWLYWIDPFTYLIGGLLEPVTWNAPVHCSSSELTYIPLAGNTTCGEYMYDFLSENAGYVTSPENTTMCAYCQYSTGADYLKTMNISHSYDGWRDIGITVLFCISSYGLVFLMMKLRSKATKTAN